MYKDARMQYFSTPSFANGSQCVDSRIFSGIGVKVNKLF